MLEFLDKPGFLIIAALAILLFGAKRLPEAARSLGRSMHILKAETKGLHSDPVTELPASPPAAAPVASAVPQIVEAPRAG